VPPLSLARQELFAQNVAAGLSATRAYQDAGYRPSRKNASALLQKHDVSGRVSEILEERSEIHRVGVAQAIQAHQVTVETILAALSRSLEGAETDKDWRAAVAAAMAQARVTGNIAPERHLVKTLGPGDLNDEELEARIEALQGTVRAAQEDLIARIGASADELTVRQLWEAEDAENGIVRSDAAIDITPADEQPGTRHMPPLGSRGVRVPDYRRLPAPAKVLTKGEAERLARRPNAGKGVAR
jgi:phage terminase small subunit